MTLPASGDISIGDLATEFGVSLPKSLGNFYRGGGIVPVIVQTVGIPASGDVELGDFYGTGRETSLTTWTQGTPSANRTWNAAAFGGGVFTALQYVGGSTMYSTDGSSWTGSTSTSGYYSAACYGGTRFVAIADTGTAVLYSDNGTSWSSGTGSSGGDWRDVTYGNGTYVAVRNGRAGSGDNYMTSTNGSSWTQRNALSQEMTTVAFGAGLFVAMSSAGTLSTYATSPDGITWTSRSLPVSGNWKRVRYGLGMFVAVPLSGDTGLYSADGLTWTTFTLPASGAWTALSAGPYGFFAAIYGSTQAASSADGITWTSRTMTLAGNWLVSMQGQGLCVVLADGFYTNKSIE